MFKGMKLMVFMTLAVVLVPLSVSAQQNPAARLGEVLPAAVAEQVIARVQGAQEMELPAQAVANLALEGVAKGRSPEEVLAAVDLLVTDLGRAREALRAGGRAPGAGEIESAASALRMGVDGAAVSELARSAPPGRSLSVPLLVMGGLAQRGLPSDEAMAAVRARLEARAPDAELLSAFGAPGGGRGQGLGPGGVGNGPAVGSGSGQGRGAGAGVPAGPPSDAGRPPTGRGRGGGPPN